METGGAGPMIQALPISILAGFRKKWEIYKDWAENISETPQNWAWFQVQDNSRGWKDQGV